MASTRGGPHPPPRPVATPTRRAPAKQRPVPQDDFFDHHLHPAPSSLSSSSASSSFARSTPVQSSPLMPARASNTGTGSGGSGGGSGTRTSTTLSSSSGPTHASNYLNDLQDDWLINTEPDPAPQPYLVDFGHPKKTSKKDPASLDDFFKPTLGPLSTPTPRMSTLANHGNHAHHTSQPKESKENRIHNSQQQHHDGRHGHGHGTQQQHQDPLDFFAQQEFKRPSRYQPQQHPPRNQPIQSAMTSPPLPSFPSTLGDYSSLARSSPSSRPTPTPSHKSQPMTPDSSSFASKHGSPSLATLSTPVSSRVSVPSSSTSSSSSSIASMTHSTSSKASTMEIPRSMDPPKVVRKITPRTTKKMPSPDTLPTWTPFLGPSSSLNPPRPLQDPLSPQPSPSLVPTLAPVAPRRTPSLAHSPLHPTSRAEMTLRPSQQYQPPPPPPPYAPAPVPPPPSIPSSTWHSQEPTFSPTLAPEPVSAVVAPSPTPIPIKPAAAARPPKELSLPTPTPTPRPRVPAPIQPQEDKDTPSKKTTAFKKTPTPAMSPLSSPPLSPTSLLLTRYPPPPPSILYSDSQITVSSLHLTIHAFYFPLNTPITIPLLSIIDMETLSEEGNGGLASWLKYKTWGMAPLTDNIWWARDHRRPVPLTAGTSPPPSANKPSGEGSTAADKESLDKKKQGAGQPGREPFQVVVRVEGEWLKKGFGVEDARGVEVLREAWKNVKESELGLRSLHPALTSLEGEDEFDHVDALGLENDLHHHAPQHRHDLPGQSGHHGAEKRRWLTYQNSWTAYPFANDSPQFLAQQRKGSSSGSLLRRQGRSNSHQSYPLGQDESCGDEPILIDSNLEVYEES